MVCTVCLVRFFSKFITESIEIAFLIIGIDARCLQSVFRPIAVWFFAVGLIGLTDLKYEKKKKNFYFYFLKTWAPKPNINTSTYSRLQTSSKYKLLFI